MRILHIVGEVGFSGGEHQLAGLLAHLAAAGHENLVVLQPSALLAPAAAGLGLPLHEVRMRSGFDPLAALAIRRRIRTLAPDLVHLADARAHKLGALGSVWARHPPLVVTRRVNKPLRRGRFTRWLYGRAVAAVVAVSESVRSEVLGAGVAPERVHVVRDGVDPERYADLTSRRSAARAAFELPPEALVIVCAARLDPRKGQIHLVRAFGDLATRHPGARLLLVGDGPEREALERTVEELGLASVVRMPGHVAILDALAAADVACVPSLNEGLSVFALEAQAAGLPVVASRVGGLVESVADGETGLLFTAGDERALGDALGRVVEDPDLRRQLGSSGRERIAREFTLRHMAEATTRLYERLARSEP